MNKLLSRIWRWPIPIHIGIGVTSFGFILIAFTWEKVATLGSVTLQLPYLVSGGLTSLGLIMIGLTIVSLSARSRDEAERRQQLDRLTEIMSAVESQLQGGGD